DTLYFWEDINIGVAAATNVGLMVPVIDDADLLTLDEIADRSKEIKEKARDGKQVSSKPSRFTISNLGMHQIDSFTAVINPPEAAILAVASIRKMPVIAEDSQMVARDMMNLTLSLDHRVGDGLLAAEFINEIKRLLENPDNLIK
ncbi:MAG TPA: 2-oxo acid dehydrogenase subunit E2, partial [Pelolinea sp.]|nr:2-oxo acid dehydrogenase subunit E2 [Pelolinea sp.]